MCTTGVRLVHAITLTDAPQLDTRYGVSNPFRPADFDLVLSRAAV
ncbi:hypothetical protein ACWC5C_09400 [Streptomyces sp. NPDC001700]